MDRVSIVEQVAGNLPGSEVSNQGGVTQLAGRRESLRAWSAFACAVGDGLAICAAALIAALARFGELEEGNTRDLLLVIVPCYFLVALGFRSYRINALLDPFRSSARALASLIIAVALTTVAAYAFKVGANYSRLEAGYLVLYAAVLLVGWRLLVAFTLSRFDPLIKLRVGVLTDAVSGQFPAHVTAVLDVHNWSQPPLPDDPHFLDETFKELRGFDRIVLSFGDTTLRNLWVEIMRRTGMQSEVLEPRLTGVHPLALGWLAGAPTLVISRGPLSFGERFTKRLFDLAIILAFAPLIVPLLCLIAIAVRLDSPGPVFFVQKRVGQNNRQFNCYKFRTMRDESCDPGGIRSATQNDARMTRLGSLLRRISFDELPQLWNVAKGEMSLVGPRPHALGSTAEGQLFWEAMQGYWLRHAVKPGLTGLAQVRGLRGPTQSRAELEQRVAADLEYINNWSLWLDTKILLTTLTVLVHEKAY